LDTRQEATGGWRKLLHEEIHNLYYIVIMAFNTLNYYLKKFELVLLTKEYQMGRTCSTHGADEKCISFVEKPEGKRRLGRDRSRWEDWPTVR
jgi:hypothetical protein